MAKAEISLPELSDIFNKLANDLKTQSPESDPFLQDSLLRAELLAFADRINSVYQTFPTVVKETFDATATTEFLELRGAEVRITRKPATQSEGNISFQGTLATIIPGNTELSDASGNLFTTQSPAGIDAKSETVILTPSIGTVEVDFGAVNHLLGNGFEIVISGASESDLNGTFACQVINANKVSYVITNQALSTPDSGDCDYELADVNVKSSGFGVINNKSGGSVISLTSPISGINTDGIVQQSGLGGGADVESDDELRVRVQFRRKNPVTHFNDNSIINQISAISYVDRVFVLDITPAIGQVTIYVMKEDLTILSAEELAEVKDAVLEITPVNTSPDDVFVLNPDQVPTPFTFSEITPNTATMQQAVTDNLQALFNEAKIGTDVTVEQYERAILNTIDPASLQPIQSFTLSTPTTDISIADGEIATLGTVTYA